MKMQQVAKAGPGWAALTKDAGGQVRAHKVRLFELEAEGVTALVPNVDGAHVANPDVVEVIKGRARDVGALAATLQVLELAERAETPEQVAAAEWLAGKVRRWAA